MSKQWVIGTSGYSYWKWRGRFYPESTSRFQFLKYYASKLNAVEINATFYRQFKPETAYQWQKETNEEFKFILKAPRTVTHRRDINLDDAFKFKSLCTHLGYHFDGVLVQFPPSQVYDLNKLKVILSLLPKGLTFLEVRHLSWYDSLDKVKSEGVTFVHPFWHDDRYFLPINNDEDVKYFRFHGTQGFTVGAYGKVELQTFAQTIYELRDLKRIYAFFNNDFEANAPLDAMILKNITSKINLTL